MNHHPEVQKICARQYLRYVRSLNLRIKTLQDNIEQQRSNLLPSGVNYSDAPAANVVGDVLENGVIKLQEMIAAYCTELSEQIEQQQIAHQVFSNLSKYEYTIALEKYYLQGKSWEQVCVDMSYSYRGMMHLKKTAELEVYSLMPEQWRRYPIPNAEIR